jgi:choline kinase
MKAIILSAGQGRRLLPLTEQLPKCCLQLHGKSMLEWQVESLAANGVNEIVVVTGFGNKFVEDVVSRVQGVSVRIRYNPFYALSDNLGTCWVVRDEMCEPFLLINGDTMFEFDLLTTLLNHRARYPITLATDRKERYDDDDMKIIADGDRLQQVGKQLDSSEVNGESIGMMLFNRAGAQAFADKVQQLMSAPDGLSRWYLSAIDELAQDGVVGICPIMGHSWCEVDDPDDLKHAIEVVSQWRKNSAETKQSDPSAAHSRQQTNSRFPH